MADVWAATAASYDWSVGGLKFNSAVTGDLPFERAFARVSKDRVDQSNDPGDQTLDGWWVRSQTDWSGGAGYDFMEPITEQPIPKTFRWSYGVDVWTPGQICLHRKPTKAASLTADGQTHMVTLGQYVFVSTGTRVWRFLVDNLKTVGWTASSPTPFVTLSHAVTGLLAAGGTLVAFTSNKDAYSINSAGTATKIFTTGQSYLNGWWVKDRLILAAGRNIYEHVIPTTSLPVNIDSTSKVMSATEEGWTWVAAAATPTDILLAGRGGSTSSIYALTIDADGSLPTLTSVVVVAEFPTSELVRDIASYLGTYLLISTTAGVRLALTGQGQIAYGPLLSCPVVNGDFSFFNRFGYASVLDAGEGRSGLVRFDLSNTTEDTRAAWAMDLRIGADDGVVTCQQILGTDCVVMGSADGNTSHVYISQPLAAAESSGTLQSGQIRMGSTVKKNWSVVGASVAGSAGSVSVYLVDDAVATAGTLTSGSVDWPVAGRVPASSTTSVRVILTSGSAPSAGLTASARTWGGLTGVSATWGQVESTYDRWWALSSGSVATGGTTTDGLTSTTATAVQPPAQSPVVELWSLRAVPAVTRTELLRIPLLCMDYEMDSRGVEVGSAGSAGARYNALAAVAGTGEALELVNLNSGQTFTCVVDDMSFRQVAKDSPGSHFGGVIDLVVRVL